METMIDDTLIDLAKQDCVSTQRHGPSDFEHIGRLFGKTSHDLLADYAEDRDFATLHQVFLGIECSKGTLEEYLASFAQPALPAESIDVPDACGRTALAWAVEYGCADAVKTLLSYGSNPHQLRSCVHGKSPLLHLVIAGPASQRSDAGVLGVVRLLLQAGADVNAADHEGWSPLHVAASWNLYNVIQELARFGGSALDWNALTDDRQSALDLSLGAGPNKKVQRLLKSKILGGAEVIFGNEDDDRTDDDYILTPGEGTSDDEADSLMEHFHDATDIL